MVFGRSYGALRCTRGRFPTVLSYIDRFPRKHIETFQRNLEIAAEFIIPVFFMCSMKYYFVCRFGNYIYGSVCCYVDVFIISNVLLRWSHSHLYLFTAARNRYYIIFYGAVWMGRIVYFRSTNENFLDKRYVTEHQRKRRAEAEPNYSQSLDTTQYGCAKTIVLSKLNEMH